MATGATGQLGLALPVQGELSGTWGDTVNNGITQYTNIAIAGTLTLTGDGAVTLANTTGDASASNITSTLAGAGTVTAQFSTVRVSGTTTTKVVTGPSYSKSYLIDNASSYTVTFKASGQTGVSISPNEKVYVYYNATDYVKVGGGGITYGAVKTTTYTAVANDGVLTNTTGGAFTVNLPATPSTGTQVFIADSAGTWGTNNLTIGRNGSTIAGSATDLVCDINSVSIQCIYDGTTWDIFAQIGANDTAVVTLNGTQTLTNKTLTAPILTAPVLGTPASGTVTNLTGTASININGTVGATTATTGAFTTLSASSTLSVTGAGSIQGLTVGRGAGAVATNTAVGASALAANSSGATNTAVGNLALRDTTTSSNNAASGYGALANNTTGASNTAHGALALVANTTASNNTAVGYQAAYSNQTGVDITAIGYTAFRNGTASYATAIGFGAMGTGVVTGTQSVAVGRYALNALTSGNDNVAVGDSALTRNTSGSNNIAIGRDALAFNTTASNNTAVGYQAGYTNSTGTYNILFGYQAGYPITTGTNNVMIGYLAGASSSYDLTTGSNNICIGGNRTSPAGAAGVHQIVLATAANIYGKGDNTAFISANAGSTYNGANTTTWATTSDQRLKKNIVDNNDGLDKITSIRVRNFEYRLPEEITELDASNAIKKSGVQLGVIAQELQAVLPECVKTESTGVMSVQSENLTWYMINAIKELKAEFDAYKSTHP